VILGISGGTGFELGLLGSSLALGLRHGIDWDHIAAISDMTAGQERARRGIWLGSVYAAGHAGVVFVIGVMVIAFGRALPDSVDSVMGRVVGWTLLLLGLLLAWTLVRNRGEAHSHSRWMLALLLVRRTWRRVADRFGSPDPGEDSTTTPEITAVPVYGTRTALGVGVLHGVGAETPTQVVIFLAAAQAGGTALGITVLAVFLAGLFMSNTLITVGTSIGFVGLNRRPALRTALAGLTAVVSIGLGILFILGRDGSLPALMAG